MVRFSKTAVDVVAARCLIAGLVAFGTVASVPSDAFARKSAQVELQQSAAKGPLTLVISIGNQSVSVYDGDKRVARAPVSTGKRGHRTPTGIFSIIQKRRQHYSNLYRGASMPFMQRITWSGIALHAGALPGYPASHGCIRLPYSFARDLFKLTTMGDRVIVTSGNVTPSMISHGNLFSVATVTETRPASNEARGEPMLIRTAAALGDAPMHLGAPTEVETATVAAGEGTATPVVSLLRQAEAEVALAVERMEAADVSRRAALAELPEMTIAAQAAEDALAAARKDVAAAEADVRKAEAAIVAAEAQIARFARSNANAGEDKLEDLAAQEEALEALLQELLDKAASARVDLSMKRGLLPEFEAKSIAAARLQISTERTKERAEILLERAKEERKEAERELKRRQLPVKMFVSRKTGKFYARQGYRPLIEADVEIEDAAHPIGTHVYMAQELDTDAGEMRWIVVTVPSSTRAVVKSSSRSTSRSAKSAAAEATEEPKVSRERMTAMAALDRIKFPPELVAQLGELVKPGSSLIVSDNGISPETGKYTDIIVEAH